MARTAWDNSAYSNEMILKIGGTVTWTCLVILSGAGLQGKGIIRNAPEVKDKCNKAIKEAYPFRIM